MEDVTVEEFRDFIKENPNFELLKDTSPFVIRIDGIHEGRGDTIREATMVAVSKASGVSRETT